MSNTKMMVALLVLHDVEYAHAMPRVSGRGAAHREMIAGERARRASTPSARRVSIAVDRQQVQRAEIRRLFTAKGKLAKP